MSMVFLYNNLIKRALSITESEYDPAFGTANLFDDDVNTVFRGDFHYFTMTGTTTLLFNFGSAVYADSVACVTNAPLNGTLLLRAGTVSSVGNFVSNIPLDVSGTSYKNISIQSYQYWRLDLRGQTGIAQHQVNELFLGIRKTITELPSYPIETGVEEDVSELVSERGQKWIYTNFNREYWVFNFEGINAATEADLYNMYKFCGKNSTPFWMILDVENDSQNIKFCRFKDRSFLSNEVTKNIFDLTLEIERDL